jgi:hypothetical protein
MGRNHLWQLCYYGHCLKLNNEIYNLKITLNILEKEVELYG